MATIMLVAQRQGHQFLARGEVALTNIQSSVIRLSVTGKFSHDV
jgi:hypothetical protein